MTTIDLSWVRPSWWTTRTAGSERSCKARAASLGSRSRRLPSQIRRCPVGAAAGAETSRNADAGPISLKTGPQERRRATIFGPPYSSSS